MLKKQLLGISCIAIIATICAPLALASNTPTSITATASAELRAELTEWKLEIIGGKLHKRLWSITQGVWLTDWIKC